MVPLTSVAEASQTPMIKTNNEIVNNANFFILITFRIFLGRFIPFFTILKAIYKDFRMQVITFILKRLKKNYK